MSELDKILGCLDDINPEAAFLSENTLSNVDTWYDTGCYALNAIISGKIRDGGIPKGRIVVFAGETQTGKTLLINKILGLAQKQGLYPVIFDSEMSVDAESGKNVGLDPEKTKYCPVYTVDECKNQISKFLDNVIERKAQGKFIISIDSLGNLAGSKEVADIEKDKSVADMGLRAKACLDPNTEIILKDNKVKKIKDLKKGDEVLTHLKRYKKVEDVWKVQHKKIIKIKLKNNTIILSPNHRLLVKRNGELIYLNASNISNSDKLIKIAQS